MSGPKISIYSLTGRARDVVLGQVWCDQQSLVCAAQIQLILASLQSYSGDFERETANAQLLMKRTSDGAEQIERIQRLKEKFSDEMTEIQIGLKVHKPHVSQKYAIDEAAYEKKQAELKILQSIKKKAETLQNEIDEVFLQNKKNSKSIQNSILQDLGLSESTEEESEPAEYLRRDSEQNMERIQSSILEDISSIYSFDLLSGEEEKKDTSAETKKKELRAELDAVVKEYVLSDELAEDVRQAKRYLETVSDLQYLNTFEAITLGGLKKRIEAYQKEQLECRKEFEVLSARYHALCAMAGEEAEKYDYTEEAADILTAEIERLEKAMIRQQEQEYIDTCVNDVMKEMGYDLIGERVVQKRSGKKFRNELFTFHEGTAVNVTYSSDGQIAMELGGISSEDRIPNEEECEILTEDMRSFCSEFEEFEKRLLEKGVMVNNRIALSPPSAEYAAVINISDYDIEEGTQITEMKTEEHRKRAAEKKEMRRIE